MIDLARYTDDQVLSTKEAATWAHVGPRAILDSRIPALPLRAREKHFRARDVRRWMLEGDRAFEHTEAPMTTTPALQLRSGKRA